MCPGQLDSLDWACWWMDHSDHAVTCLVHTWTVQRDSLNHIAWLTAVDREKRENNIYLLQGGVPRGFSAQGVCSLLYYSALSKPEFIQARLWAPLSSTVGTLFKQNGNENKLQIKKTWPYEHAVGVLLGSWKGPKHSRGQLKLQPHYFHSKITSVPKDSTYAASLLYPSACPLTAHVSSPPFGFSPTEFPTNPLNLPGWWFSTSVSVQCSRLRTNIL